MNSIFGSLSTDSLPAGYGDEGQASTPTGGIVGGLGFADAMQVAGSGSVSPFGHDADMSGLPSSQYGDYGLFEGMKQRRQERKDNRLQAQTGYISGGWDDEEEASAGEEDSGGRFKLFGSEGYFGKEARGERKASRQEKAGDKKKKKPMSGQRAANIGAGLGAFFSQAAPTVAGLFGPQQQLEPMDDGGGYTPPPKSGVSPLVIGGAVVGGLLLIGGIGIALSQSGKE